MTHLKIWQDFVKENNNYKSRKEPISFYFCDNEYDANDCANLVVKNIK